MGARVLAVLAAAVLLGVAPLAVTLNDKPLTAPAIVRNGRVLLPFRAIFSAVHANVAYDAARHEVHAQRGGDRIFIKVGTHESVIVADHLFVPVRYICESLGAKVQYDAADRIVFITDPRADMHVAQAPRSNAPDTPSVSATFSPLPIAYATPDPNAPPGFTQALNFYIPSGQRTYYAGNDLNFTLNAPPNGTAYLDLCGFSRIPFVNPYGSTQYLLHLKIPKRLAGHSCTATAYYVGPLGAQQSLTLPYAIAVEQEATPAPTPVPIQTRTPSPTPTPHQTPLPTSAPASPRTTQPVNRVPQHKATPRPRPLRTEPPL